MVSGTFRAAALLYPRGQKQQEWIRNSPAHILSIDNRAVVMAALCTTLTIKFGGLVVRLVYYTPTSYLTGGPESFSNTQEGQEAGIRG